MKEISPQLQNQIQQYQQLQQQLQLLGSQRLQLEAKLREGFDAVVVGHVHRPCMWQTERGTAVIVGDWMRERSVVELGEQGFRMLRWDGDALVSAPARAADGQPGEAVCRQPRALV